MKLLDFKEYYALHEGNIAGHWKDEEKKTFAKLQRECLIETLEGLKKHKVKVFCDGGTLLGLYRDKKFLEGDSDHDVGILAEDMKPGFVAEFEKQLTMPSNHSMFFKPRDWLGMMEADDDTKYVSAKSLKYLMREKNGDVKTFKGKPIMCDVMLHYPHKKDRLHLYVSDYFRTKNEYVAGPTKMIQNEGYSFPIPNNPAGHLEASYGKGWKTPDPQFPGNYNGIDCYGGPLKTKDLGGRYKYNYKTRDYIVQ
jgi:hypothetical protein